MKTVKENGQLAVVAKRQLAKLGTDQKNNILAVCAKALRDNAEFIVGEKCQRIWKMPKITICHRVYRID